MKKLKSFSVNTAVSLVLVICAEVFGFGFAQANELKIGEEILTINNQQTLENDSVGNDLNSVDADWNEDVNNRAEDQKKAEADFTNIIKQTTEYTCGPAALATLINLKGGNAEEMNLAKLSNANIENGVTLLDLKTTAKMLGYDVSLKNVAVINLKKYELPLLFHEKNEDGSDHYAVLKEIKADTLLIADPSAGNVEYNKDDFAKNFTGKIMLISLPKNIKSGQGADVALQILEDNGGQIYDASGKIVDIEALRDDLSDADAANVNGKFAQLLLIPIAKIGYLMLIGGTVIGFTWYLSNTEKILNGSLDALKEHMKKMQDPCNYYTSAIAKTIKNVINVIDKKLPKASNSFRKSFEKKYNPIREKALKMLDKNKC